jgi:hypothetical protein
LNVYAVFVSLCELARAETQLFLFTPAPCTCQWHVSRRALGTAVNLSFPFIACQLQSVGTREAQWQLVLTTIEHNRRETICAPNRQTARLISSEEMKVLDGSMSLLHLALCSSRSVKRKNTAASAARTDSPSSLALRQTRSIARTKSCERTSQQSKVSVNSEVCFTSAFSLTNSSCPFCRPGHGRPIFFFFFPSFPPFVLPLFLAFAA